MPPTTRRLFSFRRMMVLTHVGLVLLAAFGVGAISWLQLNRQAESQALELAALHAEMASDSLAAVPDEILASARILRDRPTLARYLRQGNRVELAPFLEQFRAGGGLDFVAVVVDGELVESAGARFDPFVLERFPDVDEPYATWWLNDRAQQPRLHAVALAPLPAGLAPIRGHVLTSRRVDSALAEARAGRSDARFAVLTRGELAEAPIGSLERATLYAAAPRARLEDERGTYGASQPMAWRDDRLLAAVVARLPTDPFRAAQARLIERWSGAVAALVVLAALIGFITSRRLGRPVKGLTAAAARMADEDFATPVPVMRDRELGLLGDTLENLRGRILSLTRELRRREAEARLLLANMSEGVFSVDADRRIRYMNPQAERLLGVDAEHALGRFCGDVLRPEPVRGRLPCHYDCPIVNARAGSDTRALEQLQCGRTKRGVVIRSAPPAGGTQVQMLRDESREEAGRRLRDSVIANVSHEFKTPLAAQVAALELLEDCDDLPAAERSELLASVGRATFRLNQLIDNLLESVRIDGNEDRLEIARHDVVALIDEAVTLVRPLLLQKRQALALDVDHAPAEIQADGKRIVQVLVNLLSNAGKYSPEDSEIALVVDTAADQLRIVLSDQGPGFDDGDDTAIFERYYRAPGLSAGQAGMGLGLWLVRSIVERHGGRVEAQSGVRGGSEFRVFLPLKLELS
ncbi:MAG: ATP-binding protein [Wenzhouxiangellaceae bacterium]|nr:ATP-binding protein [Wenzhouxiangellaceae bacterium]